MSNQAAPAWGGHLQRAACDMHQVAIQRHASSPLLIRMLIYTPAHHVRHFKQAAGAAGKDAGKCIRTEGGRTGRAHIGQ